MSTSIVVGICTFRRPQQLDRALRAIAIAIRHSGEKAAIVVVDNDGSDLALRSQIGQFAVGAGLEVTYCIERTPGISSARETVFRIAAARGATLLAMIDDDEWPSEGWLAALLRQKRSSNAVVVGGPVRPVFPAAAAALRRHSRYWAVEAQTVNGRPFIYAAGNFLIDLAAIANEERPLFDQAFGLTGGEDVVFFRRVMARGHTMSWCDTAVVYEEVPPERASLAWIRKRRFGVGNSAVRWERPAGPWRTLFKTALLTLRLPIYPLLRREPESPWLGWVLEGEKVRGRFAAHLGDVVLQYATSGRSRHGA
ncbi:MAG: glycosyltransferase family A protein [Burkholderiaceae bacterium]